MYQQIQWTPYKVDHMKNCARYVCHQRISQNMDIFFANKISFCIQFIAELATGWTHIMKSQLNMNCILSNIQFPIKRSAALLASKHFISLSSINLRTCCYSQYYSMFKRFGLEWTSKAKCRFRNKQCWMHEKIRTYTNSIEMYHDWEFLLII